MQLKPNSKERYTRLQSRLYVRADATSLGKYRNVPWLSISGMWMEAAGFSVGDYIHITVYKGKLIITQLLTAGEQAMGITQAQKAADE